MAERKCAYVPNSPRLVSSYTTGWNAEEAKKLVKESALLNPRPVVIFVRPAPKLMAAFGLTKREDESVARENKLLEGWFKPEKKNGGHTND